MDMGHGARASRRLSTMATRTLLALLLLVPVAIHAQGGRGAPAGPPPSAQAAAPIDLTGYWESYVNEDWLLRMVTPRKGDYQTLPLNAAARRVGDAWDPDKDTAAGLACKSYGAAAVMRVPGRIHITWQDPNTLRIETEAGTQTRLLRFGAPQPPAGEPTWQGHSVARWMVPGRGRQGTTLKATTTHMRAGYLRKNGVPYSANASVTEYFNVLSEAPGGPWLIVTNIVDDPQYLTQPFTTSTHFRKLADGSAWKPVLCTAK
jgi:hypothetical protein